jgi:hypothetical protein
MKKNEKQILDEVEKTLNSMDNLPVLKESRYFYTRLKTAIESGDVKRNVMDSKSFLLKPALLIIVVVVNIITAVYYFGIGSPTKSTEEILINSLKQEYSSSQNVNYLL